MPDSRALDDTTLQRMLHRAYGVHARGARWEPVGDGPCRTWHAWLGNGQEVAVRVAPADEVPTSQLEDDMMRSQVEALQVIAESTDVPVAEMHHHDDTFEIIDADWLCTSWLQGTPARPGEHDALLGRLTRGLNQIPGDGFGRFLQPTLGSWRDAFSGLFEDALDDAVACGAPLGVAAGELHRVMIEHSPVLDAVDEPVYCDWTLDPHHLLLTGDDAATAATLGHSHAFWGDPLMEAGFSALDGGPTEAYLAGRHRGPLDGDELARRDLYDLLRALVAATTRTLRPHARPLGTRSQVDVAAVLARVAARH